MNHEDGEARAFEIVRAWDEWRAKRERELDQIKRRSKILKEEVRWADDNIRTAIRADESQLTLEGMNDVGFPPDDEDKDWRSTPLWVVIGRGPALEKLEQCGVMTAGELAAFTENRSLISDAGLSEAQEAKVIESLDTFFAGRQCE